MALPLQPFRPHLMHMFERAWWCECLGAGGGRGWGVNGKGGCYLPENGTITKLTSFRLGSGLLGEETWNKALGLKTNLHRNAITSVQIYL